MWQQKQSKNKIPGLQECIQQQYGHWQKCVAMERCKKGCAAKSSDGKQQFVNFMVTPCFNNIQHFDFQLTHTTLKNEELLKHFKISKTAPTCFSLQGNHHQGATIGT